MLTKKIIPIIISFLIGVILCEGILRIKNSLIIDYDVEMWRYSNLLKKKVKNPKINHVHQKNKKAILQKVEIKTNKYGQRDINYNNVDLKSYDRRFLFIGSSVTLGWGVKSEDTYINLLNKKAKKENKKWIFINGGIGNYNTERYINNYLENWNNLEFTDIVINFFVNDTEILKTKKTNFFFKHTHLGVAFWKLQNKFKNYKTNQSLTDYYKSKYDSDYEGYINTKKEILRLINHCKKNNINCSIFLIPDIHQNNPYPLFFINRKIAKLAEENKIPLFDLYESIKGMETKKLWNEYKDPHPNKVGHLLFYKKIYEYLNK